MKTETFADLLKEYKKLYTEWGRYKPLGDVSWNLDSDCTQLWTPKGHCISVRGHVDIEAECESGQYGDTFHPRLCYDHKRDLVTIYSVHPKRQSDVLGFFDCYSSTCPKSELIEYAESHSLSLKIIMGRFSGFRSNKKNTVEVVALQGNRSAFVKAGWENALMEEQKKKEQQKEDYRKGCITTNKRFAELMSIIDQAYHSDAMSAVAEYGVGGYCSNCLEASDWSYTLYLHGVRWNMHYYASSTIEQSWFMTFSDIGYSDLETDDQLFAFAAAMFCRKQGISPYDLDVDRIEWCCEIKTDWHGRYINSPKFVLESKEKDPLKSIF